MYPNLSTKMALPYLLFMNWATSANTIEILLSLLRVNLAVFYITVGSHFTEKYGYF